MFNYLKELNVAMDKQFNSNGIDRFFPSEIASLTESDIISEACLRRKDYRRENAFTIDCADCKDMDDAVNIQKTSYGYLLMVHIADVATYVPLGSVLDQIAFSRATSIYIPEFTTPMLPAVLSNDLCSLNPGVDRNTLSVVMMLDHNGQLISSEITKGMIRSKVKGEYSEVNALLAGTADNVTRQKYTAVLNQLPVMESLYRILRDARVRNGAYVEDDNEPKIMISHHHIDLIPTVEGIAENIIEEFMVLANRVVAEYLLAHDLPAIFRVQENKNCMASYQYDLNHHAELALECYAHFTSPIRRLPDLKIHQILTMHLNGRSNKQIHDLFDEHLVEACERATKRSRTAKQVQEFCKRRCYMMYFKQHLNEQYTGKVTGFDKRRHPIINLDELNIGVVFHQFIGIPVGTSLSLKVGVNDKELYAWNVDYALAAA